MIERKKKICIQCKKPKFLFSKGRCKPCASLVSSVLKKAKTKEKKESIKELVKKLDKVFSLFVRLIHADKDGMVTCYTSGKRLHFKEAHAGHFLSRKFYVTRWDEKNVKVQSYAENIHSKGNPIEFQRRLENEFGREVIAKLIDKKYSPYKLQRIELQMMIEDYTVKVNELKTKLRIE
jgi:hypothetical protein